MLPDGGVSQAVRIDHISDLELYEREKPFYMIQGEGEGLPPSALSNIVLETRNDVLVHDLRGNEAGLDLEKDRFKYFLHDTKVGTRFGDDDVKHDLEELAAWMKQEVGADKAVCYDYRLRSNAASTTSEELSEDRSLPVLPVLLAHTDHTHQGGFNRMAKHLTTSERKKYLSGDYHCRIFNLWKPLVDEVEDNPLAICNPFSVKLNDLLAIDRVSRDWVGEIYYLKYNPGQQWWWLSKQTRQEILVFTTFDSKCPEDSLNFCPHASFINPQAEPRAPPRKSVELRVITFNKLSS